MKRVMLIVAYDGTDYCGWQVQNNGDTIEGELNKALSSLLKEEITVIGASRTDSGVHALVNVAVFDTEARMPTEKMAYALNSRLPENIRVQRSFQVADDFHPRKTSCIKTYEYRILNREFELPSERLNSHFFRKELDVVKMREACLPFLGEHDFKSFCSSRSQVENTVRTITDITIDKAGDMIHIRISGNGFLYNMVRIIVGTLMKIGLGIWPEDCMESILEAKDRTKAGPKAEAKGLTLVEIKYL